MRRRWVDEVIVAVAAVICTVVMALLFRHFGSRTDFWGLLVPLLFVIFFLCWKAVSQTREAVQGIPYAILMALVSALVLFFDLRF